MRARGQGVLTVAVAALVAIGAVAFDRLGVRPSPSPVSAAAMSMTWLCPHGGGRSYEGAVYLANPGQADVTARVTEVDADGRATSEVTVEAGSQQEVEIGATDRSSSTFVEAFGGWVAAGWLIRGAEGESGIGVEPCVQDAGRRWLSAAPSTREGERATLVLMNPFDSDAVLDVALFTAERAPIRDSDLTDIALRPRTSQAIALNEFAQGEAALGVSVEVSSGRVAASTLVVSEQRGIASVVAAPVPADRHALLTSAGVDGSELVVSVPDLAEAPAGDAVARDIGATFSAALRSQDPPQPAGGLTDQAQGPASAGAYPVPVARSSAIDLAVIEGSPVVAALRTRGPGNDGAATAGSVRPHAAWVVTPTVAGEPARPSVLVLNPGQEPASVTVTSIPDAGQAVHETQLTIAPGTVAGVPRSFLDGIGDASVHLQAAGSSIVALGASTSLGNEGLSAFGLAAGVPIPQP